MPRWKRPGGARAWAIRSGVFRRRVRRMILGDMTPLAQLALPVLPQQAFANIQRLRQLYPGLYGPYGFFDAVNPTTGSIGHRYLVLDQSMIMAALDNALANGAMQRHFAADPV